MQLGFSLGFYESQQLVFSSRWNKITVLNFIPLRLFVVTFSHPYLVLGRFSFDGGGDGGEDKKS